MTAKWLPVMEKGGVRFLAPWRGWMADSEQEAREVAWGGSLVEGIILGFRFTGEVLRLEDGQVFPHVPARLGGADVWLISGPEFDAGMAEVEAD